MCCHLLKLNNKKYKIINKKKVHKIQLTNGTQTIKKNLQKYQLKVKKAVKFHK